MSREVLGARGEAEAEDAGSPAVVRVERIPGGRDAADGSGSVVDVGTATGFAPTGSPGDPDDDSDPTDASVPRPPARRPPTAGRRALVAAGVAGAVLGAVLAVGVTQRATLREAQSTASVHAWVEQGTGRASADAIALTLRVLNTGDAPVTVVDAGMDGGLRRDGPVSVVLDEELTVPSRTMAALPMQAQADCSGAPLAENASTDGRLQLRLRTADGRERLVDPPTGGISMTSADIQESFCGQTGLRLGLSVAQMATTAAGGLSMSLLNDAREPVTLDFSSPAGTRILGEPPLPLVVEPSRRVSLSVTLEVDSCTNDAQRVRAGDLVQLVIDGRPRRGGLDSVLVNAWIARQVALACS